MGQICRHCSRLNPDDAAFCHFDGQPFEATALRGQTLDAGSRRFPSPLVFSAGIECHSFDELAMYCAQNWEQALKSLQAGALEKFLGGVGRVDLAMAARQAVEFPDPARGLDQLLEKLPTKVLTPAKLRVDRHDVKLGRLKLGEERTILLQLRNDGMRLLHGNISCENCVWLTIGEGAGVSRKMFAFIDALTIALQVRGERLRAGSRPQEAQVEIESNGGSVSIAFQAEVPVKPFPGGALAGAITPRQAAEKAKESPREAATLFEKGAVAEWYRDNGWDYPVKIPAASGIAGIQQFFEALGLTAPPKVRIQPMALKFKAQAGAKLQQSLEVSTQEKRAVWAHAVADQPWLQVTKVSDGKSAVLRVDVPSVPDRPGQILRARVTILSNGRQRFVVPVVLGVAPRATPRIARPRAKQGQPSTKPVPPAEKTAPVEEVIPLVAVDEVDDSVQIEVVDNDPAAGKPPVDTPVEIVVVEEVTEVETVEAAESSSSPSAAPAPAAEFEISQPAAQPEPSAGAANPFAFEDAPRAARRRRNKSIFAKLFGWTKDG
jgi:hypothetical protein